jgi:hypothetical protein
LTVIEIDMGSELNINIKVEIGNNTDIEMDIRDDVSIRDWH